MRVRVGISNIISDVVVVVAEVGQWVELVITSNVILH